MRFLITGANGFVGKPLCTELLRRGQTVRAAVRSWEARVEQAEVVKVGIIDGATNWAPALVNADTVIHLAARVHVMKDKSADPLTEFLKVNLYGTSKLAQQAASAGIKRLVYVSSVKVNGESTVPVSTLSSGPLSPSPSSSSSGGEGKVVFSESDEPDPQDPYAISKQQAEQVLQRICQDTGMEIVIVRPPLVYGPGVKGNFFSLMAAIDNGIPLPLAGAHNLRSLLYVGNLVDALIACATHPAAAGQTYLVRDGEDISTAMLVEKIARSLGRNSRSFHFPPGWLRRAAALLGRAEQIDRLFGSLRIDDKKIRSELAWSAPYTLEQGLHATSAWYRASRDPS